jgi:hypothetical protein
MEKPLVFCMVPCCLLPDWEYLVISDFWKKKCADLRIKTGSPTAVIHVFKKYILQKESFFVLLFSVSSLSVAPLLEFISGKFVRAIANW